MGAAAQDHPEAVDAHVHLWDLARRPQPWIDPRTMAVLDRSFGPVDVHGELPAARVGGAAVVRGQAAVGVWLELGRIAAVGEIGRTAR